MGFHALMGLWGKKEYNMCKSHEIHCFLDQKNTSAGLKVNVTHQNRPKDVCSIGVIAPPSKRSLPTIASSSHDQDGQEHKDDESTHCARTLSLCLLLCLTLFPLKADRAFLQN